MRSNKDKRKSKRVLKNNSNIFPQSKRLKMRLLYKIFLKSKMFSKILVIY